MTSVPADLALRLGEIKAEPELLESFRSGPQTVRVRVLQGGRRVADVAIGMRVRITGTVQVATEHLAVGDVLATDIATDAEVIIRVAGVPKFAARLGQFKGRRAIVITRKLF